MTNSDRRGETAPATPEAIGRPKSTSRQQTHPDQRTQTGSPEIDQANAQDGRRSKPKKKG
jgi:hypothetical protein